MGVGIVKPLSNFLKSGSFSTKFVSQRHPIIYMAVTVVIPRHTLLELRLEVSFEGSYIGAKIVLRASFFITLQSLSYLTSNTVCEMFLGFAVFTPWLLPFVLVDLTSTPIFTLWSPSLVDELSKHSIQVLLEIPVLFLKLNSANERDLLHWVQTFFPSFQ